MNVTTHQKKRHNVHMQIQCENCQHVHALYCEIYCAKSEQTSPNKHVNKYMSHRHTKTIILRKVTWYAHKRIMQAFVHMHRFECVHTVMHKQTHINGWNGCSLITGNRFQWTYCYLSVLNWSPSLIKTWDWNQLRYQGWHTDCLGHLMGGLLPNCLQMIFLLLRGEGSVGQGWGGNQEKQDYKSAFHAFTTTIVHFFLFWMNTTKDSTGLTGSGSTQVLATEEVKSVLS